MRVQELINVVVKKNQFAAYVLRKTEVLCNSDSLAKKGTINSNNST